MYATDLHIIPYELITVLRCCRSLSKLQIVIKDTFAKEIFKMCDTEIVSSVILRQAAFIGVCFNYSA